MMRCALGDSRQTDDAAGRCRTLFRPRLAGLRSRRRWRGRPVDYPGDRHCASRMRDRGLLELDLEARCLALLAAEQRECSTTSMRSPPRITGRKPRSWQFRRAGGAVSRAHRQDVVVTGYFARLAARTGVRWGGSSPPAHGAPPPQQFVTEDIAYFVTQPQRIARAPDMPSDSGEQRIRQHFRPLLQRGQRWPPFPDAGRSGFRADADRDTSRSAETPVRTADTHGRSPRAHGRGGITVDHVAASGPHRPAATVGDGNPDRAFGHRRPAAQGVNAPTSAASPLLPTPAAMNW